MKFAHIFNTFHAVWIKFRIEGVYKKLWSECKFFENWVMEGNILIHDINKFLPIPSTFWMKFTTRGLHIMLLSIYEFHENQLREGHPFLIAII
jgi:hypothetical protein